MKTAKTDKPSEIIRRFFFTIDLCEKLWGNMGKYGKIWGNMGKYGKIWEGSKFTQSTFAQNLNMKNHNTILLVTLLLIVAAVVVIVFVTRKRKKSNKNNSDPAGNSNTSPNMDTSTANTTFSQNIIMKKGDSGDNVKVLQKYLNKQYSAGLTVDGKWGDKTQKAVEKYNPAWKDGLTLVQYKYMALLSGSIYSM